jgi:3,4-dihydroxy 2-butanone 4-phosphate synthase/GTP cyclohydrolase II
VVGRGVHNHRYLETKRLVLGHSIDGGARTGAPVGTGINGIDINGIDVDEIDIDEDEGACA